MDRRKPYLGVIAMFGSAAMFAVMAALVKLAHDIDTEKMAFFRFAVGLAFVGTLAMFRRIELQFNHSKLLLARGVIGTAGVYFLYVAISKIGLGRGTVISYSYPVFASIFGFVMLKERVRLSQAIAIVIALVGIWLICRDRIVDAAEVEGKYYAMAVFGAMCSGLAVVLVRKLRASDSSFAIYLAQCVMGFWMMILPANIKPVELNYLGGLLLVAIGLSASAAQIFMTYAYAHISVATGSLICMLVPVLTTAIGLLFFGESISATALIGMVLVIVPCTIVAIRR